MLSSREVRRQPALLRRQLTRSQSSCFRITILSPVGLSPALRVPGGNITGLSTLRPEISGKRLELLKEIVPGLSRIAVLGASDNPGNAQALREVELAAGALKVQLQYLEIRSHTDIEPPFPPPLKPRSHPSLDLRIH